MWAKNSILHIKKASVVRFADAVILIQVIAQAKQLIAIVIRTVSGLMILKINISPSITPSKTIVTVHHFKGT